MDVYILSYIFYYNQHLKINVHNLEESDIFLIPVFLFLTADCNEDNESADSNVTGEETNIGMFKISALICRIPWDSLQHV